jgi:hypothetical protein
VTDKEREAFYLRTIRVSALSALRKPITVENRERVADRADELLAELEERVIRDGADEQILAAIEQTRRDIRE